MCRIDRYSTERANGNAEPREPSVLSYDDTIATQEVPMRTASLLRRPDAFAAIRGQCEAIGKNSGKRHMFVYLLASRKTLLTNEEIVVHV